MTEIFEVVGTGEEIGRALTDVAVAASGGATYAGSEESPGSKRYPTQGSVMMYFTEAPAGSSFFRR